MVERGGVRLVDSLNPRHTPAPKTERRAPPEAKAARAGLESARRLRLDSHVLAPVHEVLSGPKVRGDLVGPPGVSAKEVSEQMGHTSPEFNKRVYVRVLRQRETGDVGHARKATFGGPRHTTGTQRNRQGNVICV